MRIWGPVASYAYHAISWMCVLAVVVTLAACAFVPAPAVAAGGRAPMIESVEWGIDKEVTVGASIDPDGLATSYEIKLACAICGPPDYAPATGELPAVQETITVTLNLTGINPGTYRFEVLARNAAGHASQSSELTVPEPPPGSCPTGCGSDEQYSPEISPGELEVAKVEAEEIFRQAEAERHAKEQSQSQEEQKAKEARYAAEEAEIRRVEQMEAQEAAARERREREANDPACVVPSLKGDTVRAARRALAKAHCALGRLHSPARRMPRRVRLRVLRQGTRLGARLRHMAPVALWVGERRRRRCAQLALRRDVASPSRFSPYALPVADACELDPKQPA